MRVLITGGRGQLGMSFKKIESEYSDHDFIFADLPELDITDRALVENLIHSAGIEIIINCAAYTAVDKAESEPEEAWRINVNGVHVLSGLARDLGIKLVHLSTDYVFDGTASLPMKETETVNPLGVYGRTKWLGEQEVADSLADAVIVRTSWLYSEFGHNFVKTMLRLAAQGDHIRVVDDQYGSPTYAPDLARAIIKLVDNGVSGFDLYHYSNEGNLSWFDFAREVFFLADLNPTLVPILSNEYSAVAPRPAFSVLDTTKIRNAGAVVPHWKDSLRVCINALRK